MYKKILTENIPLPRALLPFKAKVHCMSLGASHKIFFAYQDLFFEYCLIRKQYSQRVPTCFAHYLTLCQSGDIVKTMLCPDNSHLLVFYQDFVLILSCRDETRSGEEQHYNYVDHVELPKKYHSHFIRKEKKHYILRISWSSAGKYYWKSICLNGKKNDQPKFREISKFTHSVLVVSYCKSYVLYYQQDNKQSAIRVLDRNSQTHINCCKIDRGSKISPHVTENYFMWFEGNIYFIFHFKTGKLSRYRVDYNIVTLTSHPSSDYFLLLLESNTVLIHDFKKRVAVELTHNIQQGLFITENVFSLIDNLGRWNFYEAASASSSTDDYLRRQYGLRNDSHAVFWVDIADWPPWSNVLWHSAIYNAYDVNVPGYAAGMTAAYSYAEECIQHQLPLTFDRMMELHARIISPLILSECSSRFYQGGALVQYNYESKQGYAYLSEQAFIDFIKSNYSNVSINDSCWDSDMPVTFSIDIDVNKKIISVIGIDSESKMCETDMCTLIEGRLTDNMKGATEAETIDNIAKFLCFYHPFHLVEDGSGRLVLVVLYYLMRWYKLEPSILIAPHLPSTLSWQRLAYYIREGQTLFKHFVTRDVHAIQNLMDAANQDLDKIPRLFEICATKNGSKTFIELLVEDYLLRKNCTDKSPCLSGEI